MANRNNNQNVLFLNSEVSPGNYVPEIAPKVYVSSNVSDANDVTYTIDQILDGMIVRDSAGAERTVF